MGLGKGLLRVQRILNGCVFFPHCRWVFSPVKNQIHIGTVSLGKDRILSLIYSIACLISPPVK